MKYLIKPIEFVSPLSAREVRMELEMLCGGLFDSEPFRGEVTDNSFKLTKNRLIGVVRGLPSPTLAGEYAEQDGQTRVTIFSTNGVVNWILLIFFFSALIPSFLSGLVSAFAEGWMTVLSILLSQAVLGVVIVELCYDIPMRSFRRAVSIVRKALEG